MSAVSDYSGDEVIKDLGYEVGKIDKSCRVQLKSKARALRSQAARNRT